MHEIRHRNRIPAEKNVQTDICQSISRYPGHDEGHVGSQIQSTPGSKIRYKKKIDWFAVLNPALAEAIQSLKMPPSSIFINIVDQINFDEDLILYGGISSLSKGRTMCSEILSEDQVFLWAQ